MFNYQDLLLKIVKYLLQGLAVSVAAYYIPNKKTDLQEVATIALTAATVFLVLDTLAPTIGQGARRGAGFGIGAAQVGFQPGLVEGMDGQEYMHNDKSDKLNEEMAGMEYMQNGCPLTAEEVGEGYIDKYGQDIMNRTDLSDAQKKDIIFQNMKQQLDMLDPPISDWNDHVEISKRLQLCE